MEYILVLLIVALLNGAIAYIDGLMEGIIPLTLYAEQYMSTLAGVDLFQSLFDIVFGFGVSLIVLKFLKKALKPMSCGQTGTLTRNLLQSSQTSSRQWPWQSVSLLCMTGLPRL